MALYAGRLVLYIAIFLCLGSFYAAEGIESYSPCASSPCRNNGTCSDIGDIDFMCTCAVGYYGRECQLALPCTGSPCQNGGRCSNINFSRYRCACAEGHWGSRCEISDPCLSNPCKHGGTCTNINNATYDCACTADYHGNQCEADMPCNDVTCENGGTCRNVDVLTHACDCSEGYYGATCDKVMTCDANLEVIIGQNATLIRNDTNDISKAERDPEVVPYLTTHACECARGHVWDGEGDCEAVCSSVGAWDLTASCLPDDCGAPPGVRHASSTYTTTTYTSRVTYACAEDHVLQGSSAMVCDAAGHWVPESGEQWPYCLPRPDCGIPPNIKLGRIHSVNGTGEYSAARYQCHGWARMLGDGMARCWRTLAVEEVYFCDYCPGGTITIPTVSVRWVYVPSCQRACAVPHGRPGNVTFATVKVTHCVSSSFDQYQNEVCQEPEVYHVMNGHAQQGDAMVFYGRDLCMAHEVTKVKYYYRGPEGGQKTLGSESVSCKPLCMDGVGGFQRVVGKETMTFSFKTGASVEREVVKYETVN